MNRTFGDLPETGRHEWPCRVETGPCPLRVRV